MYKKKLVNPLDTEARKLAWETVKKELSGRAIAERLGCESTTVNWWKRKQEPLRLYPHTAEKLIELLDNWPVSTPPTNTDKQQPTESPAAELTAEVSAVSSEVAVTETPVRKDHVYMIPQIERQVVLIDLINRELNEMDAERLIGIYRAIMAKII